MNWIKWKLKQLNKWLTYKLLYKARWKKCLNWESDESYWEIWHDSDKNTVTLHYVPEENYGKKDIKIEVPYDRFEDLVKFMINIR